MSIKPSDFEITVVQKGSLYTVAGKDAPALYEKLAGLPAEAQNLEIGAIQEDGSFTLRKIEAPPMAAAG